MLRGTDEERLKIMMLLAISFCVQAISLFYDITLNNYAVNTK